MLTNHLASFSASPTFFQCIG